VGKFNYARPVATASRLITRFGRSASLRRPGTSTQWSASTAPAADYPIVAVLANYTVRERDGTLIQQGDRKIIFAAQGLVITPAIGDTIDTGDGLGAYEIVDVVPVEPGGVPIVFTAQVRR
jgi:hypothetical protein